MRKVKRHKNFELSLELRDSSFVRPPRDGQRHWLLNKMMTEFANDLSELNSVAGNFVPGADTGLELDREAAELADSEIMEDWQIPLMAAMVGEVAEQGNSILEIGFGRGVAAQMIQERQVGRHVIIECNPGVLSRCSEWAQQHADREIEIVAGRWEDTLESLGQFDGIFFHTYPLSEDEVVDRVHQSSTFAEHFFDSAIQHLVEGGRFTYMTSERNSLSRAHQRALLSRFSRVSMRLVDGLKPPPDTRDAIWWGQTVVVAAEK